MAGMIYSYEADVLEYIVSGAGTTVSPTQWYVVLYTAAPSEDGTGGTEVPNANGYARQPIPVASWDATATDATLGNPATISNDVIVEFAAASGGGWGNVTHFGLAPSSTWGAADVKAWDALVTPKTIDAGDTASFAVGQLTFQLGDPDDSY